MYKITHFLKYLINPLILQIFKISRLQRFVNILMKILETMYNISSLLQTPQDSVLDIVLTDAFDYIQYLEKLIDINLMVDITITKIVKLNAMLNIVSIQ